MGFIVEFLLEAVLEAIFEVLVNVIFKGIRSLWRGLKAAIGGRRRRRSVKVISYSRSKGKDLEKV